MTTTERRRINPIIEARPVYAWAYDCCSCQQQHTDRDPLYAEHILHQSRHGLRQVRVAYAFTAE